MMASTELDPLFLKGLRLLHSRSKDSADQLKQLFDDALAQSKQAATVKDRPLGIPRSDSDGKLNMKRTRDFTDFGSTKHLSDERKQEVEKRERLKQDDIEIIHEAKLPRLDSPQRMAFYPSSPDPPKLEHFTGKKMDDDSGSSDENADADDFAMEMGLACVICKQLNVTQGKGNQLIECQECHCLYHQECHKPPATDYNANDPRRVWYCAKCTKNMKKMASKTQKPAKNNTVPVTKETPVQTRFTRPETTQPSLVLPFKRTELKAPTPQGNNQNSTNKLIGLAGLAANFSNRVTTAATSSSVSRTSTSKPVPPSSLKSFSTLAPSTHVPSTSKPLASTSSSTIKTIGTSSSSPSSPASSIPPIVIPKNSSSASSSAAKTGLGLLSSAISASTRTASSSNNGGTKPATCSLFMSADKRVQIMKKKAAKQQEKRRMPNK